MKPIPFNEQNVVYAENQVGYLPLPAHRDENGVVTSCWKISPEELSDINKTGKIYLRQMTFNKPLQPINLFTEFIKMEEQGFNPVLHCHLPEGASSETIEMLNKLITTAYQKS